MTKDSDLRVIRSEVGPLNGAARESAESLLEDLVNPYVVALQILKERLGYFEGLATKRSAAGDSTGHDKNIKALREKIDHLVSYIQGSGQALNAEAQALVDRSAAAPVDRTETAAMISRNRRRGG